MTLAPWETTLLAAAVAAGIVGRVLGPRLTAHPRWRGLAERLGARPGVIDWGLAFACAAVAAPPLVRAWETLVPNRGPSGADAPGFLGAALAFETGQYALYARDRYPGYPWLVSVLAQGGGDVVRAGTELSMGVTIAAAIPMYWIGRLLGGRVAGVVGAVIGLRQVLAVEVGRTWTSYPLVAFLDVVMLATALATVRGHRTLPVVAFAAAAALAVGSDPKQIVLVLSSSALLAAWCLYTRRGWARALALASLLAPLPLAQALALPYKLDLYPMEELVRRTPGAVAGPRILAHVHDGFRLGSDDAPEQLFPTLWRLATDLSDPPRRKWDPAFAEGLAVTFPGTSAAWGLVLLAGPLLLVARLRGREGSVPAAVLVGVFAAASMPIARWHYQHRYALAPALQAAPVAAAGFAALGPAGVLGAGLVARLHPESPFRHVDTRYMKRNVHQTDNWAMGEDIWSLNARSWAAEHLADDVELFDLSASDPTVLLATVSRYYICKNLAYQCWTAMSASKGTVVALLRARDSVSARVPGGTNEEIPLPLPAKVARCWTRIYVVRPEEALYTWSCPGTPPLRPPDPPNSAPR